MTPVHLISSDGDRSLEGNRAPTGLADSLADSQAFPRLVEPFVAVAEAPHPQVLPLACRTAFVSDTHLGSIGARVDELAELLGALRCDTLYLVGDILDLWQVRRRWHWSPACDAVLGHVLRMAREGTRVVYIPGNHDEIARRLVGCEISGVEVLSETVHVTADGRRLLVTHGDQFDLVVRHSPLLCRVGDVAYEALIRLNFLVNRLRRLLGKPYWSLSHSIKSRVKSACTFISRFENILLHEAARRGLDGVVCGHIHKAENRRIDIDGQPLDYLNSGDWVESCTLVAEDDGGALRVVDWSSWLANAWAKEAAASRPVGAAVDSSRSLAS